ncbi:MAG: hypothetical protein K1X94_07365 [Sandaracinaceae bacterium]|nr:hypothetical protein [Sandaracinaceae bacterium]
MWLTLSPADPDEGVSVSFAQSCVPNARIELRCSMAGGVDCTQTIDARSPESTFNIRISAEYTDATRRACVVVY